MDRMEIEEVGIINVRCCARCQGNHLMLAYAKLDNPSDEFHFFAVCPTKRQPILVQIIKENDTVDRVGSA